MLDSTVWVFQIYQNFPQNHLWGLQKMVWKIKYPVSSSSLHQKCFVEGNKQLKQALLQKYAHVAKNWKQKTGKMLPGLISLWLCCDMKTWILEASSTAYLIIVADHVLYEQTIHLPMVHIHLKLLSPCTHTARSPDLQISNQQSTFKVRWKRRFTS